MRNVCLVGCIAALTLALVVPASAGGPHPGSPLAQTTASGIDVAGVIETVSHRLERTKGGTLTSADRLYRVSFDDSGFAIRLRGAGSLRLRTSRALVGRSRLAVAPGAWRAERNRAERTLAHGLAERVTARSGHLEWDFVLDRPPAQTGALAIEARVSAGSTGKALRFPVGAGRAVTIGELVVRDARGRRLYHALPKLAGRKLGLGVPAHVLRAAHYPLTIDPDVSPEYPASEPFNGVRPGDQSLRSRVRRGELPRRLDLRPAEHGRRRLRHASHSCRDDPRPQRDRDCDRVAFGRVAHYRLRWNQLPRRLDKGTGWLSLRCTHQSRGRSARS